MRFRQTKTTMATALLRENFHRLLATACVIFLVNMNQLWFTTTTMDDQSSSASSLQLEQVHGRFVSTLELPPPTTQSSHQPPPPRTKIMRKAEESTTASSQRMLPKYRNLPDRNNKNVRLLPGDYIYYKNPSESWDAVPIVLESHKLIFFTVPKVGCTVWKQLFRRIMGFSDWAAQDDGIGLPHNPEANGLVYLNDFDLERANDMMTSPEWTRAIMLRDPKQRFLSAFLDKSVRNYHKHIISRCCPDESCVNDAQTIPGFLRLCARCTDDHWRPQNDRVDAKFWPYMDVILHLETAAEDAEQLLRNIGAWEQYGATGWGNTGTSAIFQRQHGGEHSNFVEWQVWKWYTPEIENQVVQFFQQDYDNPLFQFDANTCLTCSATGTSTIG